MLTQQEVADRLGVSVMTVRRYRRAGKLKAITPTARTVRISESEVQRFIAEHREGDDEPTTNGEAA